MRPFDKLRTQPLLRLGAWTIRLRGMLAGFLAGLVLSGLLAGLLIFLPLTEALTLFLVGITVLASACLALLRWGTS